MQISPFFVQHLDNKTHHLEMLKHNKHEGGSTGKNNSNIVNYYRACTTVCVSALPNLLQMMLGIGIKAMEQIRYVNSCTP